VFVSHGGIGLRTSQMTLDEIENIPRHLVEPFEERSSLLAQVILIRKVIEGGYHSILLVSCFMWSGALDISRVLLSFHVVSHEQCTHICSQTYIFIRSHRPCRNL